MFLSQDVAIASIYLASKMIDKPVELGSVPNLHVEELEVIGNQILDLRPVNQFLNQQLGYRISK